MTGGIPADEPICACRQRGFVDDAVPLLLWQLLLFAPGPWEYVMNVDGVVEVGVQVNGRTADEIATAVFHQQRSQAFVSCSQATL
jgi:hypothetical protein